MKHAFKSLTERQMMQLKQMMSILIININYINVYIYNIKPNHTTIQQTRRLECAIGQTLGEKITPIYPKHLWGDFTKSYNFGRFLTL